MVLNPGKRKRIAILEEEINLKNIGFLLILEILLEKIINGDARFKMVSKPIIRRSIKNSQHLFSILKLRRGGGRGGGQGKQAL